MDIAVLSDIHGNYRALQTCLDDAFSKGIKTFVFLGDYVGELAYPEKTMEILYRLMADYECCFIRGNKENYWLGHRACKEQGWKEVDSTTGALFYTYSHLTERDLAFFEELPICRILRMNEMPPITICHGSPEKVSEKMLDGQLRTFDMMDRAETDLILCGHTHIQNTIVHGNRKVLNPGAVGVPFYSEGKAQFLILHGTRQGWTEEFVSLSYDVEKVIADLDWEGLNRKAPYWTRVTKELLRNGKVSHGSVLARAMELCQQERGQCIWPEVPEKYWAQAAGEMLA